ncbi:TetR/AcrR family transcriptional regulator [Paracoccus sp. 1_MG-2023]|uniref:TetR/AcrR family transcriptional regulator n=1 Tax=unclassified Paracoccus (in: a-proteobacteria) TaxID=2688777 RepID=UPI002090868A|nr:MULTISPECIES: TetR/AcrR family transcriptional regulator [unclassified Paracoccus (in: a-proteobacteria)]MDO6667811.1 TetR/AcrR family transcriptional regulator [Paracoccus sp. 1_MG-2023]
MASYDRDTALDAAMGLFWAQGYHATSLKDLEHALQMRPGSIYAAFHSKEALFRATIDRYAARMAHDLETLIADAPSPIAALQAHLLGLADLAPCDKPSTACMLVKSLLEVSAGDELRRAIMDQLDRIEALLTQAVTRAAQLGEIPRDSDAGRIARRLQTYIFGLKIQAQRESDPERMHSLCADLADEIGRLTVTPAHRGHA